MHAFATIMWQLGGSKLMTTSTCTGARRNIDNVSPWSRPHEIKHHTVKEATYSGQQTVDISRKIQGYMPMTVAMHAWQVFVEDMQLIWFYFLFIYVLIYCNPILVCIVSLYKQP
jgi:hypothetical protein